VENPNTDCLVVLAQAAAFSQSEAVSCVQRQYPQYKVGAPGGNYTFAANCCDDDGDCYCYTVSNLIAISQSDAQNCVQSQYPSPCAVSQGACAD
jgi:hypothetical protein